MGSRNKLYYDDFSSLINVLHPPLSAFMMLMSLLKKLVSLCFPLSLTMFALFATIFVLISVFSSIFDVVYMVENQIFLCFLGYNS